MVFYIFSCPYPFMEPPKRIGFRIVIRKVEPPFSESVLDDLDFICRSLGFFEEIDKDKTAAALFRTLLVATERGEALSSTALADRVGMSRGAVIHHLNSLGRSGLIEKHGRFYVARSKSMYRTIEEIQEDTERIFERMKQRARQIDAKFQQRIEQ